MVSTTESPILEILRKHEREVLADWIKEQLAAPTARADLMKESELRTQSAEFLELFRQAAQSGNLTDITAPEWSKIREMLGNVSRCREAQGFTPSETATFVMSLKQPLFSRLRRELANDAEGLAEATWTTTVVLDKLGLYSIEVYQENREQIIRHQQQEILELSTPVVQLWEGILGVPVIGTLDSARTQVVMENLLQKIAETGCRVAILDITGVPVVDTQVAQHLLKTVSAARLMGAECILSGIRPQIAQTLVTLGVDLGVVTKATLADALAVAFRQAGFRVAKTDARS